ncbi:alginate O-acetyltransferase AlgX-related protein [Nevskia ramosa]|uniref:alginate O-acetyltransferase AlgX-related protein n=1 Tax=Nevskia ramosa TaxID=64002 RepID=UPI0009FD7A55|nr:hypothetical protein [Nevskia ramosa]
MSSSNTSVQAEGTKASYGYAIVGIVFALMVATLSMFSIPSVLSYRAPPVPILNGALVRNFEDHFDKEFPLRTASINLWTAAQLVLFNEGKFGVLLGTDGWLYTNEEFHVLPRWQGILDSNLEFIRWTQAKLAADSIPLAIVVVPEKAHIYPEFTGGRRQATAHAVVAKQISEVIDENETTLVRIEELLKQEKSAGEVYFRTDTHWTPLGTQVAARAIVAALSAKGLAPKAKDEKAFYTETLPQTSLKGDLLSFLPLEPMFPKLMPKLDVYTPVVTKAVSKPVDSADLLGDDSLPEVSLVGTSYTANEHWNFEGYLSEFLNESLADYSKEGIGPFPPMAQYLTGTDYASHKPRLVIWEIPERSLLGKAALEGIPLPEDLLSRLKKLNQR